MKKREKFLERNLCGKGRDLESKRCINLGIENIFFHINKICSVAKYE